jgi:hypothetical protein
VVTILYIKDVDFVAGHNIFSLSGGTHTHQSKIMGT